MRCVENTIADFDVVADIVERRHKLVKELLVLSNCEALDVFEHEVPSLEFRNNANELPHERVAGVVKNSLPYEGEALTRRAAEHNMDRLLLESGRGPDFCSARRGHALADGGAMREVVLVGCAVDRVELDRRNYVEAGLLKAQAHSPGTGKKIDRCWSHLIPSTCTP